jgi:hypothetical protein
MNVVAAKAPPQASIPGDRKQAPAACDAAGIPAEECLRSPAPPSRRQDGGGS